MLKKQDFGFEQIEKTYIALAAKAFYNEARG